MKVDWDAWSTRDLAEEDIVRLNLRDRGTANTHLEQDLELLVITPPPAPLNAQNLAQHGLSR
ncbi:hypothetical protein E2976_20295 [Paracoccus yeei]